MRCRRCGNVVAELERQPLPPITDPLLLQTAPPAVARPCGHTAGVYPDADPSDDYQRLLAGQRPGVAPQLWVGVATALVVLVFVALVAYLGWRAA